MNYIFMYAGLVALVVIVCIGYILKVMSYEDVNGPIKSRLVIEPPPPNVEDELGTMIAKMRTSIIQMAEMQDKLIARGKRRQRLMKKKFIHT